MVIDPRLVPQLGDVRLAAIREACEGGLTRTDDGWLPGYPTCDGRLPFNCHTIETLAALGLMTISGDAARTTRDGKTVLAMIRDDQFREAAE